MKTMSNYQLSIGIGETLNRDSINYQLSIIHYPLSIDIYSLT